MVEPSTVHRLGHEEIALVEQASQGPAAVGQGPTLGESPALENGEHAIELVRHRARAFGDALAQGLELTLDPIGLCGGWMSGAYCGRSIRRWASMIDRARD